MPSPPPTSTPPVASTPPSTNKNNNSPPPPPTNSSPPPPPLPLPPVANVSSPPWTNVTPSPPPLSPPPQSSNPPPPPSSSSSSSSASPPPPSRSSPPAKHSVPTTSPPPPPSSTTPSPPPPKPPTPPVPAPRPPQYPPPQPNPPRNSPPPPLPSPPPPTSNTPLPRNPPPPPNTNAPPVPSTSLSAPTPASDSPPGSSPPPIDVTSPPPPSFLSPPSLSPPLPSLVPPGSSSTNNSGRNSQPSTAGGIGTAGTVAVTSVGLLFFGVLVIVAWCLWKRKKKVFRRKGVYVVPASIGSSPNSDSGLLKVQTPLPSNGSGLGSSRALFAYDELVKATNGFSAQNILGEGGFGCVFKGNLADGRVVAVKQLKIGGGQGEREFRSEVEIISRIHHRHLVSLVGLCISEERRLLLYDFIPNNTLYFHLHGEGRPVMDWATRVQIANGAARGIAYLHEDCHPRIIHRDIKSSNILLDNNFEARVSDFGLAKLADADTHVTTHVMGTFGYMAPEYACCGKLTEKSDVYSFGVVLLELVTGRKPVDTSQPAGEESLVEWARPLLSYILETEEFRGLADPRLEGQYVDSEMFRMIEAAAGCVRHSSTMRPKMSQILRAFDSMVTSDLTNGMKVGESEMFDPAKQSEEIRLFQRMAFGCQDYTIDFLSENSWCSEANHVNSPGDRSAEFPKEFSN